MNTDQMIPVAEIKADLLYIRASLGRMHDKLDGLTSDMSYVKRRLGAAQNDSTALGDTQ